MSNEEKIMQKEIVELAGKIADYAQRKNWSTARLCREYPGLGSDRTFRDMVSGNIEGYDAAGQLANLRAAWALVEDVVGDGDTPPVYENLSTVLSLRRACLSAMKSWGSNRVVIVQGESGVGKSTAMSVLVGRYGSRMAWCEAKEVWSDKPAAMLGDILRRLGHDGNLPTGAMSRMEEVQKRLCVSRICLFIDEAHHCGPKCLNTIKSLVNSTPGEFVLLAIGTLWQKLESGAYQEARQLSTNRLSERLRLMLTERDIAMFLQLAAPGLSGDDKLARDAAKLVRPAAVASGNLSFVREVAKLLPEKVTLADVAEAVKVEAARR
ncbi:MAG: ATP-binding protein [Kiritimatiellae bacterium]|nr:ATP-binding protein [Kiritimatiellia bacterium]